jgi:enterochelin esterase-like enzyme
VILRQRPAEGPVVKRITTVAVVAVLFVVTVPVFSDLVNYSPDARMLSGPLVPSGPVDPSAAAGVSIAPWRAWLPSGAGRVKQYSLPAPWTGGSSSSVEFDVYTPPGYDSDSNRRYPTLYEVPMSYPVWGAAMNDVAPFDSLIDSGAVPPSIVVFVDSNGAPYPDSECADSFDGRQWYDQWVAETLVPWVDLRYRTTAAPAARAVMGMSEGGYCAAILPLRHPATFGSGISFSGYFHAGAAGSSSGLPFGGQQAVIDANSPDVIISQEAADAPANVYFILVAQPAQQLYGRQAAGFDSLLTSHGYPHVLIQAEQPHGWVQVRQELPSALEAWAARLVATNAL